MTTPFPAATTSSPATTISSLAATTSTPAATTPSPATKSSSPGSTPPPLAASKQLLAASTSCGPIEQNLSKKQPVSLVEAFDQMAVSLLDENLPPQETLPSSSGLPSQWSSENSALIVLPTEANPDSRMLTKAKVHNFKIYRTDGWMDHKCLFNNNYRLNLENVLKSGLMNFNLKIFPKNSKVNQPF